MALHVMLVEDDPDQAAYLVSQLREASDGAVITVIKSEYEFRTALNKGWLLESSAIILDCHFPWGGPEGVGEGVGTPYRAGIRCAKMLLAEPKGTRVPIAFWTLIDADELGDLRESVTCFGKSAEDVYNLVKWLQQCELH